MTEILSETQPERQSPNARLMDGSYVSVEAALTILASIYDYVDNNGLELVYIDRLIDVRQDYEALLDAPPKITVCHPEKNSNDMLCAQIYDVTDMPTVKYPVDRQTALKVVRNLVVLADDGNECYFQEPFADIEVLDMAFEESLRLNPKQ